jgi:hypothetical protein
MAKMIAPASAPLSAAQRDALHVLVADLTSVFGSRLRSVVAYGQNHPSASDERARALVLVEQLSTDDLRQLVPKTRDWIKRGVAVPLILTHHEFVRTLDVFPLEYGEIIATHVVVAGTNPFAGVHVADIDRRRACEHAAKSHLIHLREGYLETAGEPSRISRLIADSAPAFRTLLSHLVRLERGDDVTETAADDHTLAADVENLIGVPASLVNEVLGAVRGVSTIGDPSLLLTRYIEATEGIWRFVDGWKR